MSQRELPTCTCCPGTGYRDPTCDVHGDGLTNPLNVQMAEITDYIHKLVTETTQDHCQICNLVADHFHLWENESFPLWMSYVVQGWLSEFEEKSL